MKRVPQIMWNSKGMVSKALAPWRKFCIRKKDEAGNCHEQWEIMKCAGNMGRPLKFFFNPLMMS